MHQTAKVPTLRLQLVEPAPPDLNSVHRGICSLTQVNFDNLDFATGSIRAHDPVLELSTP